MSNKVFPIADASVDIQYVGKIIVEEVPAIFPPHDGFQEFFTRKMTVFDENGKPVISLCLFAHKVNALNVNFVGNDDVQA